MSSLSAPLVAPLGGQGIPFQAMSTPSDGALEVPGTTPVNLSISKQGAPIDYDSVVITVAGIVVWQNSAPQNGWMVNYSEDSDTIFYNVVGPRPFGRGSHVTVVIAYDYDDGT